MTDIVHNADIAAVLPGDLALSGFAWVGDAHTDLTLTFAIGNRSFGTLRCTHATEVLIDLDYGQYAGPFPAWDHEIEALDTNSYRIRFDFQPIGALSLTCVALELTRTTAERAS